MAHERAARRLHRRVVGGASRVARVNEGPLQSPSAARRAVEWVPWLQRARSRRMAHSRHVGKCGRMGRSPSNCTRLSPGSATPASTRGRGAAAIRASAEAAVRSARAQEAGEQLSSSKAAELQRLELRLGVRAGPYTDGGARRRRGVNPAQFNLAVEVAKRTDEDGTSSRMRRDGRGPVDAPDGARARDPGVWVLPVRAPQPLGARRASGGRPRGCALQSHLRQPRLSRQLPLHQAVRRASAATASTSSRTSAPRIRSRRAASRRRATARRRCRPRARRAPAGGNRLPRERHRLACAVDAAKT